jgi:nucleotide-binding universal stress UspA family protein
MNENMLVAVDGSDGSFKAVDFAADLAEKYGSRLHLLHVVPEGSVPAGLRQWARAEHVDASPVWLYEQAVADAVLQAAEDRARDRGVDRLSRIVEHGGAAQRILVVAQRIGADLIVMGTRGLSDLQGLVMGSIAHKVSHAATCTVITVR